MGDLGLIPRLGRSPREGNGYPLQYSGLEWGPKSWTQLREFHFHLKKNKTFYIMLKYSWLGLPWWLSSKVSAFQFRRPGFNLSVRKIPWSRKWQPTQAFLLEKSHGQRRLVDYGPWGHKELVMT